MVWTLALQPESEGPALISCAARLLRVGLYITASPLRRRGAQSPEYRQQIRRKINAYHLHVQLGCIAQGLLLHLALNHGAAVWKQFRSWLRTMDPSRPPSELVVQYSLRDTVHEFLDDPCGDQQLGNFAAAYRRSDNSRLLRKAG